MTELRSIGTCLVKDQLIPEPYDPIAWGWSRNYFIDVDSKKYPNQYKSKPTITMSEGIWKCSNAEAVGYSKYLSKAYEMWFAMKGEE